MILWRISNCATLDGQGGLFASARWHSRGHPIVYLAETPASALLELLVHLELDIKNLPTSYKLLKAEAPEDISIRTVEESNLPAGWREDLILTRTVGDEWLASAGATLLKVPSAVMPETFNILLNPHHPEAARVKILWHREHPWDRRLLK